jgi:cbb3-type cytochrome oxidase subunit 3
MLRYIKHNLEGIDGVEIYPLFSLLVFFIFFVALIWWVIKVDKKYVSNMKQYPLMDDEIITTENDKTDIL